MAYSTKYKQTNSLRLLNKVSSLIDIDQFYSIRFDMDGLLLLQGGYNCDLLDNLQNKKFKIWFNDGNTYAQRGPVKFIFT